MDQLYEVEQPTTQRRLRGLSKKQRHFNPVSTLPCCYEKHVLTLYPTVTIQPFREEISRIIAIYIADGGQRQLNLSSKERSSLLKALSTTTHPSAFRDVIATIEWTLRRQAHPNFIRWTICNGNPPRQWFARGLGVVTILFGIVYAVIITLSGAHRGWRAFAALLWIIGVATLFAGWKGMCVVSVPIRGPGAI